MSRLTWTQALVTGHRIIDLQHQELIDLINELGEEIDGNAERAPLRDILQRLNQYVLFHFAHEEGMMVQRKIDAEHMQMHLQQHADFAEKVRLNRRQFELMPSVDKELLGKLLAYLHQWLVDHIMGTDKLLSQLLGRPIGAVPPAPTFQKP
jgi:hemerythrin-like metal-binding protein